MTKRRIGKNYAKHNTFYNKSHHLKNRTKYRRKNELVFDHLSPYLSSKGKFTVFVLGSFICCHTSIYYRGRTPS